MKKAFSTLLTLVFAAVLFLSIGCSESTTTESVATIYGSWTRLITDDAGLQFNAELKIDENSYNFIVLDEGTGHTDSYAELTISGNKMLIVSDEDCLSLGEAATYEYLLTSEKLSLFAVEDSCYPRVKAIQGIWNKK